MRIQIIGGGIVGLSIARSLLLKGYKNVEVIEKESEIAKHQSSRNSGVMHAGLYYKPGSLKAKLSRDGIVKMKAYCKSNNIEWLYQTQRSLRSHPWLHPLDPYL